MNNTITKQSTDNTLHIAVFTGNSVNPQDVKDIGQDLEVTSNDYIASLPIDAGAEYEYDYQLTIIRKKIN